MFSTLISIDEFFYQKHDVVTPHCNLWGDFNLSLNGTLELNVADQIYLSLPNYGLWIPPQTEHCCTAVNDLLTHYICIRIHPTLCQSFAQLTQTLNVRPFLRQTITEILEQQKTPKIPLGFFVVFVFNVLKLMLKKFKCARSPFYGCLYIKLGFSYVSQNKIC